MLSFITIFATMLISEPIFEAQTIDHRVSEGRAVAVGDVDGDGRPDIILAEKEQLVWYRNGDWERFIILSHPFGYESTALAVCDTDGDGRVEVAVAIQTHTASGLSGYVTYMYPAADATQPWEMQRMRDEMVVRHMSWVNPTGQSHYLVLHPVTLADKGGSRKVWLYEKGDKDAAEWKRRIIDSFMDTIHHIHVYDHGNGEMFYISGNDGVRGYHYEKGRWLHDLSMWLARGRSIGYFGVGQVASRNTYVLAAVEPVQGSEATVYTPGLSDSSFVHNNIWRVVLERNMKSSNVLQTGDFLGLGRDQIIAGWPKPNQYDVFGIKLYIPFNQYWEAMDAYWLDRDELSCDGLAVIDLDGDGKLDVIGYGNATNNLKIYWNRSKE